MRAGSYRHVTRQLAEGRHTVDATDDDGGMLNAWVHQVT